jgi:outer membrane lipoprotein-sorting protein
LDRGGTTPVTPETEAGMRLCTLAAASILIPILSSQTQTPSADVTEIARRIDNLYRSNSSFSQVVMEIITPDWQRTLEMQVWTVGTDKTFLRILSPRKERGVGTLRVGTEMWNYFPRINKVMKIPPSMMMTSWMGSDFTNDDLVREFTLVKDYDFKLIRPDQALPDMLYVQAIPKKAVPVVWSRVLIAVREPDLIPVWEEYYDEKDMLVRRMDFSDIRVFGKRTVPATLTLVPANKAGHKTVLRYSEIEFDRKVDDSIMTLRNLRSFK